MAEKERDTTPSGDEAKQLAKEAMEEFDRGNKDEGEFVMNEARSLDKKAADETVQQHGKGAGKKG
jgi:hypothetical protein